MKHPTVFSTLRCIAITIGMIVILTAPAFAEDDDFECPRRGKGIANKTIGTIDLGPEIEGLDGHTFRMRFWTVQPGGVVPVHSHEGRPAMIYFLKGTIIQHRSDRDEPEEFGPGDVSVEAEGVRHWWENKGAETVEMIAIDIVEQAM